jgi:hypothetical protein
MPCDTVRSTITEPSDTGHLESRRAKILAKKSSDSFARIAVLCLKHRFGDVFRNPRTKNCHFFCENRQNRYTVSDGISSRKGKVVNDKGNLRWRFPVNSVVGRTIGDCVSVLILLKPYLLFHLFLMPKCSQ